MENPDLRMATGMNSNQKGVRIRRINPTAPESKVLKPSDIILSFDEVDIANDGTGNCSFLFNEICTLFNLIRFYPVSLYFLQRFKIVVCSQRSVIVVSNSSNCSGLINDIRFCVVN